MTSARVLTAVALASLLAPYPARAGVVDNRCDVSFVTGADPSLEDATYGVLTAAIVAGAPDATGTTIRCAVQRSADPGVDVVADAAASGPAPRTAMLVEPVQWIGRGGPLWLWTSYAWDDASGHHVVSFVDLVEA